MLTFDVVYNGVTVYFQRVGGIGTDDLQLATSHWLNSVACLLFIAHLIFAWIEMSKFCEYISLKDSIIYFTKKIAVAHRGNSDNNNKVLSFVSRCSHLGCESRGFDCILQVFIR